MSVVWNHRPVSSWGRVTRGRQLTTRPRFRDSLPKSLEPCAETEAATILPLGLARSYGDSCLNSTGRLVDMTSLDRVIDFDPEAGRLRAEAGLSLSAALSLIVPQGWFLPTTPGTRFVTLGGAVANDVHGKNHHTAGSFGCAVTRLGLLRSDGSRHELSPEREAELFAATIGGLGLTGVIEWVEIDVRKIGSAYLDSETIAFANLREFFQLSEESAAHWEHCVSWVDCTAREQDLGRGLFMRGRYRDDGDLTPHRDETLLALPLDLPSFLLNRWSLGAFNALYHGYGKRRGGLSCSHYASFFYPLDAIRQWNRLYGRRGLYQYQCLVPPEAAEPAMTELLRRVARSGEGSFLAVLKTFGSKRSPGLLSFPREGTTLALDFVNRGEATLRLLAELDQIVCEAEGRVYPAKDGRMPAQVFRQGYPDWPRFAEQIDPGFSSDFWRRVAA